MKKFLIGVSSALVGLALFAAPAFAAKPVDICQYVVDGNIPYASTHFLASNFLTTGYDVFGYNYQAHIFNGTYGNAYFGRSRWAPYTGDDTAYLSTYPTAAGHWAWPFRNVNLQMKWNDAWLANKDCEPDNVLDRHAGFTEYKGSGAWLTNHATGTYLGNEHWTVTGQHIITFVLGSSYPHDIFLTDTNGVLTGNGGYPVGGPYSYTWNITSGSITGTSFAFDAVYTGGPDATGTIMHVTGTISPDGSLSGSWDDNYLGGFRAGIWTMPAGTAQKVKDTCTVSDFVKIISPPADAYLAGGIWYTADGKEIGKEIWGEFAIIQEIASDPCDEYGVINYMSPLKKGLGNW